MFQFIFSFQPKHAKLQFRSE